jgi:hypothetical protein
MKNALLFLPFLLAISLSGPIYSQTKPAKAPARVAPKPATNTNVNTAVPSRSNSATLPQKQTPIQQNNRVTQPAKPAPAARPQYSSRRSSGCSSRGSGGLGYEKGDNLLNVGVGLSSYYYGNPLGISFELGVDKDFSVGAQFDYNSGNYGDYYYYNSRWRYTATYFGARGSYHFNRLFRLNSSKVDLYAGLGLGYRSFRWNDSNYGYGYDYRSGLFFNYFVGGKYYFTDKIGAFAEFGYTGLSSARVGLTVKF